VVVVVHVPYDLSSLTSHTYQLPRGLNVNTGSLSEERQRTSAYLISLHLRYLLLHGPHGLYTTHKRDKTNLLSLCLAQK
jgi:hypothetical protein